MILLTENDIFKTKMHFYSKDILSTECIHFIHIHMYKIFNTILLIATLLYINIKNITITLTLCLKQLLIFLQNYTNIHLSSLHKHTWWHQHLSPNIKLHKHVWFIY